jgi:nicotinate phosphoribosyltransferase
LRNRENGKAEADLICLYDEVVDDTKPIEIFDPVHTWKRKVMDSYTATELLVPIFKKGELVYELPTITEIKKHCEEEIEGMWDEVRRFNNPHNYYVDLSEKLWTIKDSMIAEHRKRK